MKKLIISFLTLLLVVLLTACSSGDVPAGMQVAADGSDGYRVYVPGNWVVDASFGRLSSYVSSADHSGITLTFRDLTPKGPATPQAFYQLDYPELATLPDFLIISEGNDLLVDQNYAYYVVYSYTIEESAYQSEAVYAVQNGRCYLLTYTATAEKFAKYEENVGKIISYLSFSDDRTEHTVTNLYFEDDAAPAGMRRASNPAIADYRLYVPESYIVKTAVDNTLVYVSEDDKTAFSVYSTVPSVTSVTEYFEAYKTDLSRIYQDFTVLSESTEASFGPRNNIFMAEYTGTFAGKPYRVRQYMMALGYRLYIFTYTAEDRLNEDGVTYFDAHLDELDKIAAAFRFNGEKQ